MTRRNPYPKVVAGGERTYEIHEAAQLTGLAPARLRVWERRYAVVRPARQPNGYRAYTAEQVALLRSYARLIEAGERIGDLVVQPIEEVLNRAEARDIDESAHGALLAAVVSFDRDRLEALVAEQLRARGLSGFAREVALPLAQVLGDLWVLGKVPIAAEHLASEVVVHALKAGLRDSRGAGQICLAACLPGERHEWGFLASLADVQDLGWQVHYLGADLPVDDVVDAAWKRKAQAVAFSVSDPRLLEPQLSALSRLPARLPPRAMPIIGGGGVAPFEHILRSAGYRIGLESFTVGAPETSARGAVGT
jgi:DNA-binding transcriptional MerR regulator/methylmalonyl-CoA mutase cobalamin-binding subunit